MAYRRRPHVYSRESLYPLDVSLGGTAPSSPPAAPSSGSMTLVFTPGTESLDLTWPAVADATGYKVKRSAVAGGPYTEIEDTASTSYSDTQVPYGKERFYYVVSAYNGAGDGANSGELSAVCYFSHKFAIIKEGTNDLIVRYEIDSGTGGSTLIDRPDTGNIQEFTYRYDNDMMMIGEPSFSLLSRFKILGNAVRYDGPVHSSLSNVYGGRIYGDDTWYYTVGGSNASAYRQDTFNNNASDAVEYTSGKSAQTQAMFIDRTNEEIYIATGAGDILKRATDGSGSTTAWTEVTDTMTITPSTIDALAVDHINSKLLYSASAGSTLYRSDLDGSNEETLVLSATITSLDIDFASNEALVGYTTGWTRVDLSTFLEVGSAAITGKSSVTHVEGLGTNTALVYDTTVHNGNGRVYIDLDPVIRVDTDTIKIQRATALAGPYSDLVTVSNLLTEGNQYHVDSTVSNDTEYFYRLVITDVAGNVYPNSTPASVTPTDTDAIVSDGLVAEFKFDEGSGSTVGDSVASDDGTIAGSAVWDATGLILDGTDDTVSWADTIGGVEFDMSRDNDPTETFTFLLAARADDTGANTLFSKAADPDTADRQFELLSESNDLSLRVHGATTTLESGTGQTEKVYQLVWDGGRSDMVAYVDTDEIYVGEGTDAIEPGTVNCYLGSLNGSSQFTNGKAYYLAVYNRRLTPAEVMKNYNELFEILGDRGVTLVDAKV